MAEEFMIVLTGTTGEVRLYNLADAALTWPQVAALARALCTIPVFEPAAEEGCGGDADSAAGTRDGAVEAGTGRGGATDSAGGEGHDRGRTEGARAVAAEVLSRTAAQQPKTTVLTALAVNAVPAPSELAAAGWELREATRRVWAAPDAR
ncbi:hypothetical protein [Lacticaseibacillus kribbianus]|uniref:hypothetical protein n=1 Tax=Lacticaseibacillus kribbianus TaxID=2926292 RepID=UPI001CD35B95|nr:hypothetical protein [Lacticaseibacillus kribbianus]